MKKVALVRHGKKAGELIDPAQLTEIENNGIPGLNELLQPGQEIVIGLGSGLERTAQTILAFQAYMEKKGFVPAQILAGENRFGNAELFAKMTGNADLMTEVKKSGWYNAMSSLTPDWLKEIQEAEYAALTAIFDAVPNGDQVIIIGHTPMIELLALYVGPQCTIEPTLALKELEGIMFTQDATGIKVKNLIV